MTDRGADSASGTIDASLERPPESDGRRVARVYVITLVLSLSSAVLGLFTVIQTSRAESRLRAAMAGMHKPLPLVGDLLGRYVLPLAEAFRSVTIMGGLLVTFLFFALACSLWMLRRTVRHAERQQHERDRLERDRADLLRRLDRLGRLVEGLAAPNGSNSD